jgi:predicted GTPase
MTAPIESLDPKHTEIVQVKPTHTENTDKLGVVESLDKLIEASLENILGQNYVDEYSGATTHLGVDEIAKQLAQTTIAYITEREHEAYKKGYIDGVIAEVNGLSKPLLSTQEEQMNDTPEPIESLDELVDQLFEWGYNEKEFMFDCHPQAKQAIEALITEREREAREQLALEVLFMCQESDPRSLQNIREHIKANLTSLSTQEGDK